MSRKRTPGAQPGNLNALKHGSYSDRFCVATRAGRMVRWLEGQLEQDLGGPPTARQQLLIGRAAFASYVCRQIELELLQHGGVRDHLHNRYLRYSRELRQSLKTLGLNRTRREQDLAAYVEERYGEE